MAQFYLAVLLESGLGVPKDIREAVRLYKVAAEQGDEDAQVALGNHYLDGEGVPQDFEMAHYWLRMAANRGNGIALHNLEVIFTKGLGIRTDLVEAHNMV